MIRNNLSYIKRFENVIYDTDYLEEVEKVISAINNSNIEKLRTQLELYPLDCDGKDNHLSVYGMNVDGENLFLHLNKFIKSDSFQDWIEKSDFKYAFFLDIGDPLRKESKDSITFLNCYFDPNYLSVESDGDQAIFIDENYLEYSYNISKSIYDLLKNLSSIGYNLYQYQHAYILIKK